MAIFQSKQVTIKIYLLNFFLQILKKGPNVKAYFRLGDCYFNMEKYDLAVKNL